MRGWFRSACGVMPRDLPGLPDLSTDALDSFAAACAARDLGEERRLAYVAATRAAFWLACTGYWWGDAASPLGPSVFLTEVRAACEAGAGTVAQWAAEPAEDAENPALAEPAAASWPAEPAGPRQEAVQQAADLVQAALAGRRAGGAAPAGSRAGGAAPGEGPGDLAGGAATERRGPRPGRGLAAGHRTAARRAGGMAQRGGRGGLAAAAAVGVLAGGDGPRPGRAGPADPPADAAAAGPAGPPGHRVPPLAGGAVQPAAADRPGRPARRGRRPGRPGRRGRQRPGGAARAVRGG